MRVADRWVAWSCLAYMLFFVYGSLVPLHWQPQPWVEAWQTFLSLPGPHWRAEERVDAAVNFLLPLPLAFALAHLAAALPSGALKLGLRLALWPALALLALSVEFAQSFFPPRDPSWSDVAAQWVGSVAGLVLFAAFGRRFDTFLVRLTQQAGRARVTELLALYLALLLAFSVMPLDLSLSPAELYRKWRDGRVILQPFTTPYAGLWMVAYEFLSDAVLWVPVGLLWRMDGRDRGLASVVGRGLLAATVVEMAQLFVMSRVTDINDIVLAGLGVALGAMLPQWLGGWVAWERARQARWLLLAWWLWLGVAVVILWSPFDFDAGRFTPQLAWQAFTRLPFETYFFRGEFGALSEMLRKIMVFLPGGLLLGAWAARRPAEVAAAPQLAALAMLAFGLEFGQLFEPSKLADATDATLGALGAALGWRIGRSVMAQDWAPLLAPKVPVTPTTVQPVPAARAPVGPPRAALHLATMALLALLIWAAGRLPGLPYNVAKLMPQGAAGVLSALGLALAVWWMLAAPLWLLAPQRRQLRLAFPLLLLAHALLTFVLLRITVPLQMVHKIIGNPVLGWGGPWEDMVRWLALHMSMMLPVWGGVLLVRMLWRPATVADFIHWCFMVLLLAGPLHWAVVAQAGTDNLVELMRGGGSVATSLALGTALWLLATAGSALALAAVQPRRRLGLLLLAVLAGAAVPALLQLGLEPVLIKYDRAFSALQFILSASRDRYAAGPELALRLLLALLVAVAGVALLQAPFWRGLAAGVAGRHPRGGALPAA